MSDERIETVSSLGERALVARLRSRIAETQGVKVGIGDDCALVETPAASLLTTDTLVEGVHFDRALTPARLLGRKAARDNRLPQFRKPGGAGSDVAVQTRDRGNIGGRRQS